MPQKIYFRWRQQEAVAIVVDVQIGQIWRMLMVNDDSSFWGALSSLLMKLCGPVLDFLCETSLFQASFIDCSGGSFLTMLQLQIFWPWTTVESGLSACTPRKALRGGGAKASVAICQLAFMIEENMIQDILISHDLNLYKSKMFCSCGHIQFFHTWEC